MAYDSPKAAHFVAYDKPSGGEELLWNDRAGLAARWQAAKAIESAGFTNLLAKLSPAEVEEIGRICRDVSGQVGFEVALIPF
jgi:hypothetical protein